MIDDGALVRRLGVLTETLHAVFYFAPEATAAYESVGLRGYWRGYFASRCAALPRSYDLAPWAVTSSSGAGQRAHSRMAPSYTHGR